MKIYKLETISNIDLEEIRALINLGAMIIYPTETCYGIGVNAANSDAVTKLIEYKNRPAGKAISIAVGEVTQVEDYVQLEAASKKLAENFLPGPITLVAVSKGKVDSRLEAEDGTLGVRIPAYPFVLDLLKGQDWALTSTSANLSGDANPYSVEKLLAELPESKRKLINIVIDAGTLPFNPPSLVIDTTKKNQVYREGLLDEIDLEKGEVFESESVEGTKNIAAKFVQKQLNLGINNLLVLLEGELGAGKTQFAAGIGEALGITKVINSPTFALLKEYKFNAGDNIGIFYHADLWRLEEQVSLDELGIESEGSKIVAVEWSDKLKARYKYKCSIYSVKLFKTGADSRKIVITRRNEL
jgi:L-threonylcarbamoyladenylate synthase